ncbi:MAG: putative histidine kinase [Parcubacteria group bacterium GW2011_GWF2_38_76]|nr:MAG: putative histidine kinase [Parcubacteria group bacterium GW2011_GWF2_38_76]HBM45830.1 histidine kinase [Patescibacteria group bacterium]
MITKEQIIIIAKEKGKLRTTELATQFQVSRQYVNLLITELVGDEKLIKLGSTKNSFYVLPEYARAHKEIFPHKYLKLFKNEGLEEHHVLDKIEQTFPALKTLPENVRSIFTYAFSEMLNNAIEHSRSLRVGVEVSTPDNMLTFTIQDSGVGVFRNVMEKRRLNSELEAIQDILKGKTTTMPKSHSGEGIFFTSKAGDIFILDSYGYQLIIDNKIPDVFVKKVNKIKKGTRVTFKLSAVSGRHLSEVFKKYTDIGDDSDFGFDKTEIRVKLYTVAGVHISRSQARRVLFGLDKFKVVVLDFDKVPTVGQAFADEIFRVFQQKYPQVKIETENMSEGVNFMIERAKNEANKTLSSDEIEKI